MTAQIITADILRNRKHDFYEQFHIDLNAGIKSFAMQIDTLEVEHQKIIAKSEDAHIKLAIKQAGEPELADRALTERCEYDPHQRKLVVIPETYGIIPSSIKPYHAQALLRNPSPELADRQLQLAIIFLGDIPAIDRTELTALEGELSALKSLRKGGEGKHIDRIPTTGTGFNADEYPAYVERTYGKGKA